MFDFSWSEIMLIGAVALVVIGPKDMPRVLRTAGQWARKARAISREFQSSVEQMIREAELDDVKKEFDKATSVNLESEFQKTIDPTGSLAEHLAPPEVPTPAVAASVPAEIAALPEPVAAEQLTAAAPVEGAPAPPLAEPAPIAEPVLEATPTAESVPVAANSPSTLAPRPAGSAS